MNIWFIVTIPPYFIDNIECKASLGREEYLGSDTTKTLMTGKLIATQGVK